MMSTSRYIHKTLFLEGESSDVTIFMLNKAWKLHKVYICQSPYFSSMFNGDWTEANNKVVDIEINDPNITIESLSVVLGSFYAYEVTLQPTEVVANLATASHFLHQSLIDQCTEMMIETMNIETVVNYFNAAITYNLPLVRKAAQKWLEVNVMNFNHFKASFLRSIQPDLMTQLVASPNLVALQTEFGIYFMLRFWLYVHLNENAEMDWERIESFFENRTWNEPFLLSERGKRLAAPFKALRHKYLVLHVEDVNVMRNDLLMPSSWFHDAYREQWLHILRVNAGEDQGPKDMSEEEFAKECFRCGRCIVSSSSDYVWRLEGFYNGLELIVYFDGHELRVTRNHSQGTDCIQANNTKHYIIFKASLISLNEQRQVDHVQTSGILKLALHKNESKKVMTIDETLKYPLFLSLNIQMVTPFAQT